MNSIFKPVSGLWIADVTLPGGEFGELEEPLGFDVWRERHENPKGPWPSAQAITQLRGAVGLYPSLVFTLQDPGANPARRAKELAGITRTASDLRRKIREANPHSIAALAKKLADQYPLLPKSSPEQALRRTDQFLQGVTAAAAQATAEAQSLPGRGRPGEDARAVVVYLICRLFVNCRGDSFAGGIPREDLLDLLQEALQARFRMSDQTRRQLIASPRRRTLEELVNRFLWLEDCLEEPLVFSFTGLTSISEDATQEEIDDLAEPDTGPYSVSTARMLRRLARGERIPFSVEYLGGACPPVSDWPPTRK